MTAQTPVTRTVTVTAKDGVLGSVLSPWTSDSPLDQERGGKWGAEAKQGYRLGLCEFRDSLFSDWPGIQAQSCCSGSGEVAQSLRSLGVRRGWVGRGGCGGGSAGLCGDYRVARETEVLSALAEGKGLALGAEGGFNGPTQPRRCCLTRGN